MPGPGIRVVMVPAKRTVVRLVGDGDRRRVRKRRGHEYARRDRLGELVPPSEKNTRFRRKFVWTVMDLSEKRADFKWPITDL